MSFLGNGIKRVKYRRSFLIISRRITMTKKVDEKDLLFLELINKHPEMKERM
jgi:hypothetical protein